MGIRVHGFRQLHPHTGVALALASANRHVLDAKLHLGQVGVECLFQLGLAQHSAIQPLQTTFCAVLNPPRLGRTAIL